MKFVSNVSSLFCENLLVNAQNDGIQKIVVGAVIIKSSKALVLRRCSDDFMGGLVELPSGGVDKDENLLDALLREVKEETGLDTSVIDKYIGCFDYVSGSGKKARQLNFSLQVYENQDVLLNPKEHDWFDWLKIDQTELSKHNISEHTKNTLLSAIEN